MTSSISKLTKENEDLINSMTSMELFNFLDERYRDMYDKKIIPRPSEVRARNGQMLLLFFSIMILGVIAFEIIASFPDLVASLFFPILFIFGFLMLFLDHIPFFKSMKRRNKLFNSQRILKIADMEYEKGLSFYLSKEFEVLRDGTLG
tara:strand:+ start:6627 stop:7070 length:444 start_codon:yes stop_codon:yes gene_type:complete